MIFLTVLLIAVALSMDAFAVSVVTGASSKKLKARYAFRMAAFFGFFQAFMPLVGLSSSLLVRKYIESYDHWIAFGLLLAVGVKMIYESFKLKSESINFDPAKISVLFVLSIATSIDAFAVGITLSFFTTAFLPTVLFIGLVTFLLSYLGIFIGTRIGHFFENKIQALGGLVLIAIGLKILLQHLLS